MNTSTKNIDDRKYHYFYKITNLINGHYYYGVHNTNNLNDGYMGSGKRLQYAYIKYGKENFKKDILKFFNTTEEAFIYESEIVNEILVNDKECYNLIKGGGDAGQGITVKDTKTGKYLKCKRDNEKLLSGEYVNIWKGRKHKQETIDKVKDTYKKIHHQQGEKNSNYGNCWVMKEGKSIRIPKDNLQKYLDDGWKKGRTCGNDNYVNVNNGKEFKLINKNKLQEYLDNGWFRGIGKFEYTRLTSDL